jgi:hypothetical protein
LDSVPRIVLRVIGISLVVVNLLLFFTPTSVFPGFGVGSPPVEIVKERSGLRCDGYGVDQPDQPLA